ncbi:MAG: ATP-binding protein [Pseudomonadota bacterium]
MAAHAQHPGRLDALVARLSPQAGGVLIMGAAAVAGSFFLDQPQIALAVLVIGAAMVGLATITKLFAAFFAKKRARAMQAVSAFIESDATPTIVADATGAVLTMNAAARDSLVVQGGDHSTPHVTDLLSAHFADAQQAVLRLQTDARASGAAREVTLGGNGAVELSVHVVADRCFCWRMRENQSDAVPPEAAATQAPSNLPMLTANEAGTVLSMNPAARSMVGARIKSLDALADGALRPGERVAVQTQTGPVTCVPAEVAGGAGRREIYLLPVPESAVDLTDDAWSFFDEVPVALLKVDAQGQILAASRAARELLASAQPTGRNVGDVFESLGRSVRDWVAEAAEGRGLRQSEFLGVADTDDDVFVQVTLNRVKEDGVPVIYAVLNDATELKLLEKQFVHSQKMQAIGQLAGGVAHDFNNLLTAISGHCDLLLLRRDASNPDYGDLMQIHQNANRAASLVAQLLAFSRKQNLRPEALDMRETLAEMGHLLNRLVGEKTVLEQEHPSRLPPIRADRRQLEQVLMNLVVNARDAMPNGGRIVISTEESRLEEPLRHGRALVPAGDYVLVRVRDEGIGIAPDKQTQIFEPFFTTKNVGEGTGLGLSTAYGIVKQSGGYIFVDSVVGEGTQFTLFFPVMLRDGSVPVSGADTGAGTLMAPPDHPAPSPQATVLLVEDEAPVRAFASRALRLRGFMVLEADSAEAALETLKDESVDVDIFVTDVVMPGRDGPSWVREALRTRPETRVVFVSGYAKETLADKQANIPNSVFLPKPFSLNELTAVVQEALQ